MTLEQMLRELGQIDGHGEPTEAYALVRLNSFEANAIAKALKAGQAMRDEAHLIRVDEQGLKRYGASEVGFSCAVRDWDALVGGTDVK